MHSKRSLIRALTRGLYAGGLLLLVAGLLLSAISSPALAAGVASLNPAATKTTAKPGTTVKTTVATDCGCGTATPTAKPGQKTATPAPGGPSSLIFTSGCNCSCSAVSATVCNVGSGDMKTAVNWDLYFSVNGNPAVNGVKLDTGMLGPLKAGQCANLSYTPSKSGNYAYVTKQEKGGVGDGTVWSNSCVVSGSCFPKTATPTATPFLPATSTHTPTVTNTPPAVIITPGTATATRPPLAYNLSAVCGYAGDNYLLWKVANSTGAEVSYTWQVIGSGESGSGKAPAHGDDYFTTSAGEKTVRILVNDQVVDTETSVAACKEYLNLSYTCTSTGLDWYANNPNSFAVDYTFKLENGQTGTGTMAANAHQLITHTSAGAHRLDLTWTDTRPGSHTVSLSSPENSCTVTPTPTYTPTNTPPAVIITLTPTLTNTPVIPTRTFTPTFTNTPTNTPPAVIITLTPTLTNTPVIPTRTLTPTNTATFTVTPSFTPSFIPTRTNTPTNTPPAVIITFTNTPSVTPSFIPTRTNTPTNTNTPPASVITLTPSFTPSFIPTRTNTPTDTNTPPASVITLTPSVTPSFIPTTSSSTPQAAQLPSFTPTTEAYPYPAPVTATNTPVPATPTRITTLPAPAPQSTRTPALVPVTGADMTDAVGAGGLSLLGSLFTNTGLFMLGLALALTGITGQWKK